MSIDKSKITLEQIKKAMECETPEELIAYAKFEGFDISKEEAEAYLAELDNIELDNLELGKVAGGSCYLVDCDLFSHVIK